MDEMTFGVRIDTANDAFGEHPHDARPEVARILRELADRVEAGTLSGYLRDVNGNTVGTYGFGAA